MTAAAPIMAPEISIVVPLFNEGANVIPLTRRVLGAFAESPAAIELLLVNDGSTDDTWDRILEASRADGRVRGLRHERSCGQSAALWTGFVHSQGTILATLDGDLQNDPADLPRMLGILDECDMVCGVRTKRADNRLRRISSAIARNARRLSLGVDFADTGCNLRVFKRWVLSQVPPFNGLHRFMPILAHNAGAVVRETPVLHHPRAAGVSKYGVWNRLGRGVYDLMMVRLYMRRQFKKVATTENSSTAEKPADTRRELSGKTRD
jgi:dolichol-phosphate mannosyltransferase